MSDIEIPNPNSNPLSQLRPEKGLKKFKPGDVIYFKRTKETAGPHGRFQEFKGHGFGILLGMIPPGVADPPAAFLFALMSQHGWVTFDDVAQFLGQPAVDALLEQVQNKYLAKPEPAAPALIAVTPETPNGPA